MPLVRQAQQGDREAFTEIIRLEGGWVYGRCFRVQRNETDAMDVFQESWVGAWNGLKGFNGDSDAQFRAWLGTITYRENWVWLRRYRGHESQSRSLSEEETQRTVEEIKAALPKSGGDDNEVISLILARLPDDCQRLLRLHYGEGRKYNEIANSNLKAVVKTVENRTNYCLLLAKEVWTKLQARQGVN